MSQHEIVTEIDRYISWPAQALAYKLGEMLIRDKRAQAEAALGAEFDQRWFHDTILGLRSVPLSVLADELDRLDRRRRTEPVSGPRRALMRRRGSAPQACPAKAPPTRPVAPASISRMRRPGLRQSLSAGYGAEQLPGVRLPRIR
jgi:hypothetical protein